MLEVPYVAAEFTHTDKGSTMNRLRAWLTKGSAEEKRTLATLSGISTAMLDQYAGEHRKPSATAARKIELASARMAKTHELPVIRRQDLCEACGRCEYAKAAAKKR